MRKWLSLVAIAAFTVVGCNKSPEGGAPGTDSSFKVSAPTIPNAIKQGTREVANLSINRGSDFKKDVKLSVKSPDKIEAKLNKDVVRANEPAEFNITLEVAKDAPIGDHTVVVTGTPDGGGQATSVEFTVKVVSP